MNFVQVSRRLLIAHSRLPSSALTLTLRFKSDDKSSNLDDKQIKADFEELAKQLDEKLKDKSKEKELEFEQGFMNFQKLREVCDLLLYLNCLI
jgi:hypothetical protein